MFHIKKRNLSLQNSLSPCMHQKKGHVRTQKEADCLQASKRALARNQPCRHLDLGLLASKTVRK